MKLAPSKNPQKESKQFGIIALVCGICSLLLWFIAIAGLAFSARALILSIRTKSKPYITISTIAAIVNVISLFVYFGYKV